MRRCKRGRPCLGVEKFHHSDDYLTGLFVVQTYTITPKTMKPAGKHIGYRIHKSVGKGRVWLNYCPWCGVDQRECGMVDAQKKRKRAAQGKPTTGGGLYQRKKG